MEKSEKGENPKIQYNGDNGTNTHILGSTPPIIFQAHYLKEFEKTQRKIKPAKIQCSRIIFP